MSVSERFEALQRQAQAHASELDSPDAYPRRSGAVRSRGGRAAGA